VLAAGVDRCGAAAAKKLAVRGGQKNKARYVTHMSGEKY